MKQVKIAPEQSKILEGYGIPANSLQGIAVLEYGKGEFICMEGHSMTHLLLILDGKAKVCFAMENGKDLLLCFYCVGGIIGDLELMMNTDKAKSSVQAITAVKCISIPFHSNRTVLQSNTAFLNRIGTALARKLNRCTKNSACIILYPLETRLCSYIETMNKDGFFTDKLTEVAELLGTSYRHLLRSLHSLCLKGILEKRGNGYYVNDARALHQNAKDFYRPVES